MNHRLSDTPDMVVVDPRDRDYADLVEAALAREFSVRMVPCGRDALRLTSAATRLRVVNVRLPDMSGLELAEMLKARSDAAALAIVCDDYRPEDECAALALGAVRFLCKPIEPWWLLRLCDSVPSSQRPFVRPAQ